jgi:Zn-dependent peptidase ImmA (M78 family)
MVRKSKRIQKTIEQLLGQMNILIPPVDVRRVAQNINLQVHEDELGDISGLIFREGSQVIIGVNSGHHENRKRFTIAHEIGHYFLHAQNPLFVDKIFAIKLRDHVSSEAVSIEEIEANAFAAELLMPTHMLRKDLQQISSEILEYTDDHGSLDVVLDKLAKTYQVSKQAMTIRLAAALIAPSLVCAIALPF